MQNDQQWDDLTRQWQQQPVTQQPDINLIKRRVRWHRMRISGLILLDLLITVVTAFFLYYGIAHDYAWSLLLWLGFGVAFGVFIAFRGMLIRIKSWRLPALSTKSWLDYEIRRAQSQLGYANLTRISTIVFMVFFHLWLLTGYFFDPEFRLDFNIQGILIYIFALLWMSVFWVVANRLKKRATNNIDRYLVEQHLLH